MTAEAIGYFSIILIIESSFFTQFMHDIHKHRNDNVTMTETSNHNDIDEDIVQEVQRIANYMQLSSVDESYDNIPTHEDGCENIREEKEAVGNENLKNSSKTIGEYILIMENIRKTYITSFLTSVGNVKHALRGITFGIKRGERFGLLGINGSAAFAYLNIELLLLL